MKRVISLFLFSVMVFMLCIPSFASTANFGQSSQFAFSENQESKTIVTTEMINSIITSQDDYYEVFEKVSNDFSDLEDAFVDTNTCTPLRITDDGRILYEVSFQNGIVNQATVERDDDNILTVDYYEGEIHNVVKFLPNGNLLVDGTEVEITADNNQYEPPLSSKNVLPPPLRMSNSEYSLSPWGPESYYSTYRGSYSGDSCSWGVSTLVGLAVGTVATILSSHISPGLGFSVYSNLLSGVASSMITHCNIYGMEDAYFSWDFAKFESVASMATDHYYKFTGYCHSRHGGGGTHFPHTFYKHTYFT